MIENLLIRIIEQLAQGDRLLGQQISGDRSWVDLVVEISRSHLPTRIYAKN
jgi:hypothetical protein